MLCKLCATSAIRSLVIDFPIRVWYCSAMTIILIFTGLYVFARVIIASVMVTIDSHLELALKIGVDNQAQVAHWVEGVRLMQKNVNTAMVNACTGLYWLSSVIVMIVLVIQILQ